MSDLQNLTRGSRTPAGADASVDAKASAVPRPPRRWVLRVALPLAIVLALLTLIGYAMRDVLLPAKEVAVVRAVAVSSQPGTDTDAENRTPGGSAGGGAVVAQAPGWVEPDPYPIYVPALADGVVAKVHVLEGDPVQAGQVLVELVDDDARLALQKAQAAYARSQAAVAAAQSDYNEPVALERAQATTRARLAEAEAALKRLDAEVAKERARLAELDAAYRRLAEISGGAVSKLEVEAAKYKAQSQEAALQATRQRRPELEAQVASAKADYAATKRDLELKTELRKTRDEAVAAARSNKAALDEAELRLERMTLKSPVDGVVMHRLVAPGAKLMQGGDGEHSAHALHLYEPQKMQVRVDVPLADAASVGVGQRAEVVVDVLPDRTFTGEVTRLVNRADIAKNTVQFKVALDQPSELLKPDMLARVKFFSGGGEAGNSDTGGGVAAGSSAVAIASSAVIESDGEAYVWWVSPEDGRLQRRAVTLGRERGDGSVVVRSGLNPGDVIVDDPAPALEAGQRVRYTKAPTHDA